MCINHVGNGQNKNTSSCGFDIKFCTQNVRGLNNSLKRTKVFNRFKTKADVIFVQESHSTNKIENDWKNLWDGEIFFSHGSSASRGCMIMFKNTLEFSFIDSKIDENGRFIFIKCIIQGNKFFLINVYGPNKEQEHKNFLYEMHNAATDFYDDEFYHVIGGGDWNFIEDLELDKKCGIKRLWVESISQITKFKEHFDLSDI